jgi:hypothetical protein
LITCLIEHLDAKKKRQQGISKSVLISSNVMLIGEQKGGKACSMLEREKCVFEYWTDNLKGQGHLSVGRRLPSG